MKLEGFFIIRCFLSKKKGKCFLGENELGIVQFDVTTSLYMLTSMLKNACFCMDGGVFICKLVSCHMGHLRCNTHQIELNYWTRSYFHIAVWNLCKFVSRSVLLMLQVSGSTSFKTKQHIIDIFLTIEKTCNTKPKKHVTVIFMYFS